MPAASDLIYHYTTLPTLRRIVADGVIRLHTQTLYSDAFGRVPIRDTPPLIWLTRTPLGEGTTAMKARHAGYAGNGVGHFARIAVPETVAPLDLMEYTAAAGIPPEDWTWVLRTADLIGIDPTVWRIAIREIPASEWTAVEVMTAIDADGTTWGQQ